MYRKAEESTYWTFTCLRNYVTEWDYILTTDAFFKSPKHSSAGNKAAVSGNWIRKHIWVCVKKHINWIYIFLNWVKRYYLSFNKAFMLSDIKWFNTCWLSRGSCQGTFLSSVSVKLWIVHVSSKYKYERWDIWNWKTYILRSWNSSLIMLSHIFHLIKKLLLFLPYNFAFVWMSSKCMGLKTNKLHYRDIKIFFRFIYLNSVYNLKCQCHKIPITNKIIVLLNI